MAELIASVIIFLLTHTIPAYVPLRENLVCHLGERPYRIVYGIITLAVLAWIGFAYANAPYVELWGQPAWTRWVPILTMPVACLLLIGGVAAINPFSLSFRKAGFDPNRPGLIGLCRHPVMWSFALWSLAHLAPNGDVASLLIFGLMFGLSLYGPVALESKKRRTMIADKGRAAWDGLMACRGKLRGGNGWVAGFIGGGAFYLLSLWSHEYLIGQSPVP